MVDKILVVDDEVSLLETLDYNLKKQGYEVETASDGPTALALARSIHPDLVVLDLMLPGMDGFEVCREIRKEMSMPVLMLTAMGAVTLVLLIACAANAAPRGRQYYSSPP